MLRHRLQASLLVVACLSSRASAQQPAASTAYPLDPLTTAEHWVIYDVIRTSGKMDTTTRYASVLLREPPKAEVLAWQPGKPMRREATVTLTREGGKTIEAVVDIQGKKLLSWKEVPGVQANWTTTDWEKVKELLLADKRFRDALAKRGFTDMNTLRCGGGPPSYFDTPEQRGRRIAIADCSDRHGVYQSDGRPIEGLYAVVDLSAGKVLRVVDTGPVAVPTGPVDIDQEALGAPGLAPSALSVSQPNGPSFALKGTEVSWQHWRFRFRVDPRVGLVVNNVRYDDGGTLRSILYEGSLSEIFVPYMDPDEDWYTRTFLDAGEYSHWGLAKPLRENVDCPSNAVYFNSVLADDKGIPQRRNRLACLFEQLPGSVAWRHGDGDYTIEGRVARNLVVRATATIGNYDYIFDWVFQQDGSIRILVGATGILEVKGVNAPAVAMDGGARGDAVAADRYGRFVAPNTIGVNHDHFLSFRLDLDVDGTNNSLESDRLVTQRLAATSPRRSLWVVEPRIARTERDGMLDARADTPAVWRIINPGVKGPLGYPTSVEIRAGHSAMSLLTKDDWPQIRAGFSDHELWVTPYSPDERYAAGDFPTLSNGPQGLPTWTKANRGVENTDIVVWYTMGFHHVPRSEDWPVMPTMWHEVEIRPYDFFARNPTLDLPQTP